MTDEAIREFADDGTTLGKAQRENLPKGRVSPKQGLQDLVRTKVRVDGMTRELICVDG